MSVDLHRAHSMVNMYVRNQAYQKYEFPKCQLNIGSLVGQGAFGQVHQATAIGLTRTDGELLTVAIKSLRGKPHLEQAFLTYVTQQAERMLRVLAV